MTDAAAAEMEERLRAGDVEHVLTEFPDINGISRSKQVTAERFLAKWDGGFSMNMPLLASTPMTDIADESRYAAGIDYADGTVRPIPSTFRVLPWDDDLARVLCDFEFEGEPAGAYPRHVLQRVLDDVDDALEVYAGSELEFSLLSVTEEGYEPATDHKHECVSWATEAVAPFYERVADWSEAYGVPLHTMHHEYGAGQLEVLFDHGRPLAQSDTTFDFKRLVKRAARDDGKRATFMARPFTDHSANGYHLHVSAFRDGDNAFAAGDGELSATGRQFVGGLLEHFDALAAILAPTLNSFKRFQPGGFAPATASWSYGNRMTSVRVPESGPVRVENRLGSADANPYLVTAATLAAGFHGVAAGIEPDDPVSGDPAGRRDPLPATPGLALRALEHDDVLIEALGQEFVDVYLAVKRTELAAFNDHVTDFERDQYVETL